MLSIEGIDGAASVLQKEDLESKIKDLTSIGIMTIDTYRRDPRGRNILKAFGCDEDKEIKVNTK